MALSICENFHLFAMANHIEKKLNLLSDYLTFGINTLDLHNEKFYKLLEELRIYSITKENSAVIQEILNEFEAYSVYHFEVEECMMQACNFYNTEQHIEHHQFFIKKIQEFKQLFRYGNTVADVQILNFVRKWFVVHISEMDKNFADFYKIKKQTIC